MAPWNWCAFGIELSAVASLVVRYLEPLIKFLFAGATMVAAHDHAAQWFTQPMFWANEIWVALLLVIFVTMQELSRVLGKDKMKLMFIGR